MRLLFLSRWYPYPADNGSRSRILNLLKQLALRHEVHLIAFSPEPVSDERRRALAAYCASVAAVPYRGFQPQRWQARLSFFSRRPRSALDTFSPELEQRARQTARTHAPDLVIASQIDMALYPLRLPGVPRLLEELEITGRCEAYARQRQPLKKLRAGLTWWKLRRYVAELLRTYDGCTVAGDDERRRVLEIAPGHSNVVTVPNGVDLAHYAGKFGPLLPDTLVYAGSLTYRPNLDAVQFFAREVLPRIRTQRPGVRLLVTGRLDGVPRASLPAGEGVVLTGYLDDVRPAVAGSWLSVAPLRVGGGTRVKILEALALGTPVVATAKGAEGLDLEPGRHLLLADDAAGLAAAALRVLGDAALRERLSRAGRAAVAARYDWAAIGAAYRELVERLAAGRGATASRDVPARDTVLA